jgi:hypothetical protein
MQPNQSAADLVMTFFISLVLTWGIGLLPPVVTRFGILRRPLEKMPAIIFVVVFWMVNIGIFVTWLGSRSRSHFALSLVAIASYYILRIGKKA